MDFALNVNMDGYNIHTQPTKSSHGDIAINLKKSLDYTIRDDLSVVSDELMKHFGLRLKWESRILGPTCLKHRPRS